MDALLEKVLEAHGGKARWDELKTVKATITYGGPFWEFKGNADFAVTEIVEADLYQEWIRHTEPETGRVIEYYKKADKVIIMDADGKVVDELENPRASFDGYTTETKWTAAQAGYFRSYAVWHYLAEPIVFTLPGVEAHEIEPWTEGDETWRVLQVTYPKTIDAHNEVELYYFNEAGLLRRMDYQPVVNGYSPTAHYIQETDLIDGLPVPTLRYVHIRNDDRTPDLSWVPITLALSDVSFNS
ncbi:hypothetical protein [Leifsonia sp. Leaf264]|uniref:hypothetical protein n=1 Tax=Leifsonia sp. Leaf264 TaxID=1736314 RepID=UPI0006F26D12|nr:hypothetical protein [Leifsonia sp. Leaf264]KQP01396.1 hypothetical protein ASF30_01915 [Leifsonia sp. Leaf264]